MTIEEALIVLDSILGQEQLTHLQETVFRRSWEGQTYEQIATAEDYDPDYVKLVGSQLWQTLSEVMGQRVTKNNFRVALRQWVARSEERGERGEENTAPSPLSPYPSLQDWGEAIDVSSFCGRSTELAELETWIVGEQARLVAILGMGGIGKTTLSIKLAQQLVENREQGTGNREKRANSLSTQHSALSTFEFVIWRSLRNARPLDAILADLIQVLSRQQETELPDSADGKLSRLMHYLRTSRCLIILDNVESILGTGDRTGHYPIGYEFYGELFRRIGETMHQSCLVITSREKPREVATLEGQAVRSLRLIGLKEPEANELLRPKQLEANERTFKELIDLYAGNPLALKIAGATIQELFDGDVSEFLTQETAVFGDISDLLDEQFDCLSDLEQQIMYWLAIDREGVSLAELSDDVLPMISKRELIDALASLARRPIVEKQGACFTQQPVVMEYVINKFIDRMYAELVTGEFHRLMTHALMKASVEDHIRQSQIRIIVQPLLARLATRFHYQTDLEDHLRHTLIKLRQQFGCAPGYAAGNILNLLCCLKADLAGYDFSGLSVWQAHLQSAGLYHVNFSDADLSKSVFSESLGDVWSVAFSSDGASLAVTDTTGSIHVWRVSDGQKLMTCEGHQNWVCSVAFSSDDKTLVSSGGDHTIKIWNARTGECLQTLTDHTDWVLSVAISPDDQRLASSSSDHTIRLWDFKTRNCLHVFDGHQHWICKITFSPDGRWLASASDDRTIKLWDVQTHECVKTLEGHTDAVRGVAFHPTGTELASASSDGAVRVWDIETGSCLKTLRGHLNQIRCVDYSPDGMTIVSSSFDETIKLWDRATGKCLKTLHQHQAPVRSVTFSPDGRLLASGSADQSVRLWHAQTGECCKTLQGYTNFVMSTVVSPDDQLIASTSTDQTVNLWDRHSGKQLKTLYGHTNWAWSVAFTSDAQTFASGSLDSTIRVWDRNSGDCLKVLRGHTNWVLDVEFSPDQATLTSGSLDQTIRLWDFRTGECLRILTSQSRIWSIAYSPDGESLASGEEDHTIHLWNPHTGQCLQTLLGHRNRVMSLAFTPDGKRLISGSEDNTLRVWDVKTGQCCQICHDNDRRVALSSDGTTIASAGVDHTVKLWDLNSGECQAVLRGHTARIWSVSFSSDGEVLVSGSEDETIRMWDVETGECIQVLQKPRPYEGMTITNVTGMTDAQKLTLRTLGAIGH
jgi:WD40 repeat protein